MYNAEMYINLFDLPFKNSVDIAIRAVYNTSMHSSRIK